MTQPLRELNEYDKAALRGIIFLDEHVPDWRANLKKDELTLFHCDQCIIGQWLAPFKMTYRNLAYWLKDAVGEDQAHEWLEEHGFLTTRHPYSNAWAYLDAAWKRML